MSATRPAETACIAAPQPLVTLVGRTSAGKSSLGNALVGEAAFAVGVEHGTTCEARAVPFRCGYRLQDTPGLLDGDTCRSVAFEAAQISELVVLVTKGQLYREELNFLRELCSLQNAWNATRGERPKRRSLVFLNGYDLKERTMPSSERAHELAALRAQVAGWLDYAAVLTGAAAPEDGGQPLIGSLEEYLMHFFRSSPATAFA